MSIIGQVGKQSTKVKVLHTSIHIVLLLGAVTMLYPFLMMLSASIKSAVDSTHMSVVPAYLFSNAALYQKYVESRYNEESNRLSDNYAGRYAAFSEVQIPYTNRLQAFLDWREFLTVSQNQASVYDYYVSEQYGRGVYPYNQRQIRNQLRKESDNDLTKFNNTYGTGVQVWEQIVLEEKDIHTRNFMSGSSGYLGRYQRFKQGLPLQHRNYINLDGCFVQTELYPLFNGDLQALNQRFGKAYAQWSEILLTRSCPTDSLQPYWLHFVKQVLNIHHIVLTPSALPQFRSMLQDKYGSLELLNQTWNTGYQSFGDIALPARLPDSGALVEDVTYFVENRAQPEDLEVRSINEDFRYWLNDKYEMTSLLNKAWDAGYTAFADIALMAEPPLEHLAKLQDWRDFALSGGLEYLRIKPTAQTLWIDFLTRKYPTQEGKLDLAKVSILYHSRYTSYDDIYPPAELPSQTQLRTIWLEFIRDNLAPNYMQLKVDATSGALFRRFLRNKYRDIALLNNKWHLSYADFSAIPYPMQEIDYYTFYEQRGAIRREFLTRNYIMVLDQMFRDVGSVRNTLIYTLLSILLAITVNPLAAYALSRFKPRFAYKVIMLFMLTMAFPAMVMGIPNFLLLKKLNLLNTFWALILPAAADGYFIFLLKGFFDSLPRELYESARLHGAGEFRMFWQFTLYLSKPILAVIALNAFNAAYRNFLFAFIVCQDQSMWTLMVHIYELMQRASNSVGFAALVIAAIPTLAVFVFFQNIIIKGIVVPMEK